MDYVYWKVLQTQTEMMQNSKSQQNEDIRSQWTTVKKIFQWLEDSKKILVGIGIAKEREFVNEDGGTEFLFIPKDCCKQIISWNETDHPLSYEVDCSGPQASSYTNPGLPRTGGSSIGETTTLQGCMAQQLHMKLSLPCVFLTVEQGRLIIRGLRPNG
uniref:Uncharacterized protein n=1 Tax=Corethron hystrix TaxID=216773 RepID=A0A7S1B9G4_9STRA|mmetsp:Transcript_18189/g.41452  ORF Transcript_18189/g.41452 Transcript_18189/m.41452 type:complete len:158 (+) Transcript_18189:343-816(+)